MVLGLGLKVYIHIYGLEFRINVRILLYFLSVGFLI